MVSGLWKHLECDYGRGWLIRKARDTKDKSSRNREVVSVAVCVIQTHNKQGVGYQEIAGRPHNEERERQVVFLQSIRFKGVGWSWIFS